MSVSLSRVDGPGDAELIAAVRGGDVDAYGELFARHVDAARRLARQLAGPSDADDLVSDAFTKVLTVLQRGGGPDLAFRAYLLTAVRRLHVDRIRSGARLRPVDDLTPFDPGLPFQDTAVEGFDNATAARAFASLPERWQMVLWHTEVEQQKPADIAPLLGMSANSVSALAYRAREGLRQAFLSQHAADPDDVDCAWTRDHLGAYIRGGLSRRDATRVEDHLESCRACAAVYLELTEVNSGLAAILAPLLLGTAGAAYLSSTGAAGAGGTSLSAAWSATRTFLGGHTAVTAVGGVMLTAVASVAVYVGAHAILASPASDNAGLDHPLQSVTGTAHPGTSGPGHGRGNPSRSTSTDQTTAPGASPSDSTSTTPTSPATDASSTGPTQPTSSESSTDPGSPSTSTEPTSQPTQPTDQPITFSSTPPPHPAFGDTYEVSASGGSGGTIVFSIDDATTFNACTISGSTVTFRHAGDCVIDATQSGNRSPQSRAKPVQQVVTVPQQPQTVDFVVPKGASVGDQPVDLQPTGGGSDNPVTLTVTQGDVACSLRKDGQTIAFDHAGPCEVTATQQGDHDYLDAAPVTRHWTVSRGTPSISFALPNARDVGTGSDLSATSDSDGALTFAVDPATTNNACALANGDTSVTYQHVGACVVTVSQAETADYVAGSSSETVTVGPGTPTISFSLPGSGAVGTTDPLTASSNSDGAFSFAVGPATTNGACTVNRAQTEVRYQHVGDCVVIASESAGADYDAATSAERVTVGQGSAPITFALPGTGAVGTGDDLSATSDSDGAFTFAIDPATTHQACELTQGGTRVHYLHVGACVVDVSQAATDDYVAGSSSQTVTVGRGVPSISFALPGTRPVGTHDGLSATSDSDGAFSFAIDPATTNNACTLTGGGTTVTYQHVGDCVVTATEAAGTDYDGATATQHVAVTRGAQSITFSLPGTAALGSTVTATVSGGDSGNPVVLGSDTPALCSVSGTRVTFDHAGTCSVTATQQGDADYADADPVTRTVDVAKAAQSITFSLPGTAPLGSTYAANPTGGGSGNPVVLASGSPAVCSVSGTTVSFDHAGTCVVTADQAGNADYEAAPTVTASVTVPRATQSITFTSQPPANAVVGDTYAVSATSDSGNPVTFSVDPATTGNACTVAGSTVTFRHVGTCLVDADVAADADHSAAPTATQQIVVHRASQTITFTSTPPAAPGLGDTYQVSATAGSGDPVTFSVDPRTTRAACTVSGSTVTFQHAGTCVIDADQAGNADFAPAPTARQSVTVAKAAQTITFTSSPPTPAFVGTTYAVTATGGASGKPVVIGSSTPGVCSVTGSTVKFLALGTCTLVANQAGSDDYDPAPTVTQGVTVAANPGDLSVTARVSTRPPSSDSHWHQVDVTVHNLAVGATATVTADSSGANVLVLPEFNCWFQKDGVCHVTSPPTDPTVSFFVWLPSSSQGAQVTFTVASDTSPDPDPSNDSVTVDVLPWARIE